MELEICCTDAGSILEAARCGVRRVELCCDIASGGTTPTPGMVKLARENGIPSVNVLVRPRGGNFIYSAMELDVMLEDIAALGKAGATGVVIGALDIEGNLDVNMMKLLIKAARDMETILSRAIDVSADPMQTLQTAVGLRMDRVLTSGGKESVKKGLRELALMQEVAGNYITIMAGGGIRPDLVEDLAGIGIPAIHSTASWAHDPTGGPKVPDGYPGFGYYPHPYSGTPAIQQLQHAISTLSH